MKEEMIQILENKGIKKSYAESVVWCIESMIPVWRNNLEYRVDPASERFGGVRVIMLDPRGMGADEEKFARRKVRARLCRMIRSMKEITGCLPPPFHADAERVGLMLKALLARASARRGRRGNWIIREVADGVEEILRRHNIKPGTRTNRVSLVARLTSSVLSKLNVNIDAETQHYHFMELEKHKRSAL